MLRHRYLALAITVVAVVLVVRGAPAWSVIAAALAAYLIIAIGLTMLGGLARPRPEPPPPGELRKVRLTYQCAACGAEVRMTAAATEDPEPPRHCMEEMRLVSSPYDD
jgi:hypothetical protein